MNELVIQNNKGNDVTTSLIVAEIFGKEHYNVIRDIETLSCSDSFRLLNFEDTPYVHPQNGQTYKMYEMTKDGFSFLVMGYTGEKAGQFKEKFINEFNKRDSLLKSEDYILLRSQEILNHRVKQIEAQLCDAAKQISLLKPKADFADRVIDCGDKIDIGQAAKLLKLPFGRNTLFVKLRELGILFKNKNEPKQEYIDRKYFEVYEVPIKRENHPDFVTLKILVTQKGLAFLHKIFESELSDRKLAKIR